ILQWPIGMLSDRIDRRLVILGSSAMIAIIMLALALLAPVKGAVLRGEQGDGLRILIIGLFGLWGGFALTLYAICIAHAHDRGAPGQAVRLTSSLLFAWALGSTIGPLVVGLLMERLGEASLFYFAAGVAALLAVFSASRLRTREAAPADERGEFSGVPPVTSPLIGKLAPGEPEPVPAPKREPARVAG
ncbi:MAG: MFS transporter, partial [Geminicoccales bacterium]